MFNGNQIPNPNPNQNQNENENQNQNQNENQDQVQIPDPEQTRHVNAMYWEKMKEMRNLTFWLHVVAGTLVTVEIQTVAQKTVETLAPTPAVAKTLENVASVHLKDFIHPFFIGFEALYAWFMFSAALSPPSTGNIEVILIMLFNGTSSYYYLLKFNEDRAFQLLMVWCASAFLLWIFSAADTLNQIYDIVGTAINRITSGVKTIWRFLTAQPAHP